MHAPGMGCNATLAAPWKWDYNPAMDTRTSSIALDRLRQFLMAVRPMLGDEITAVWLARALVRFDRGPLLAGPTLGPTLRALGLRSVRRRRGAHRVMSWIMPGQPKPRAGRPRSPW
jgi:hypothetical protein